MHSRCLRTRIERTISLTMLTSRPPSREVDFRHGRYTVSQTSKGAQSGGRCNMAASLVITDKISQNEALSLMKCMKIMCRIGQRSFWSSLT